MFNKAEYHRERIKRLKENHMCIICGKQDHRTLNGLTRCEECVKKYATAIRERNKRYYAEHKDDPEYKAKHNELSKKWVEENRDRWNAYQREYRRKRKAEGDQNND